MRRLGFGSTTQKFIASLDRCKTPQASVVLFFLRRARIYCNELQCGGRTHRTAHFLPEKSCSTGPTAMLLFLSFRDENTPHGSVCHVCTERRRQRPKASHSHKHGNTPTKENITRECPGGIQHPCLLRCPPVLGILGLRSPIFLVAESASRLFTLVEVPAVSTVAASLVVFPLPAGTNARLDPFGTDG